MAALFVRLFPNLFLLKSFSVSRKKPNEIEWRFLSARFVQMQTKIRASLAITLPPNNVSLVRFIYVEQRVTQFPFIQEGEKINGRRRQLSSSELEKF